MHDAFRLRGKNTKPNPKSRKNCLDLWRERIDYRVYSSSCALHDAVRNILSGVRAILCHVSCRSHRSCLDSANGNGDREDYRKERFHSTK